MLGRRDVRRRGPPGLAVGGTPASTTTTVSSAPAPTTDPRTGAGPGVDVYAHTRAGMLAPAVANDPARVYVPNSLSNTVDVIDPTTLRIVDHFAVGDTPQHVVPAYDLSTLYVNNNKGNSLTPIDPHTGRPGAPIPVDDPYNLYFTPDGGRAIVMAERNSRVDFRDPHTWTLIRSVPIPHAGVNHADFTPDGRTMIASCEFSGWLVRIDLDTMQLTGELKVGGMPVDVRSSPDGTVMYVANQGRGGVSIVDPATMTEIGFVPTGRGAHGLYPSRDGTRLYVTNRLAGSISVIDFATRAVVATWDIGGSPGHGRRQRRRQPLLGERPLRRTGLRGRHRHRTARRLDRRRPRSARRRCVPPARPGQPRPHRQLPLTGSRATRNHGRLQANP